MTTTDLPDTPASPTTPAAAAEAPARKPRAPRKKVVAADLTSEPSAASVASAAEPVAETLVEALVEAVAKPAAKPRARAKPKAKAEPVAVEEATVAAVATTEAEQPVPPPGVAVVAAVPRDVSSTVPPAQPVQAEIVEIADAVEPKVAEGAAGLTDADSPPAEDDGPEAGRRRRNRRRGRRAGERAAEAAGANGGDPANPDAQPEAGADGTTVLSAADAAPRPAPLPVDAADLFAEVLSGAYDVEPEGPVDEVATLVPPKRVLAPEPDAPKLHKVLAQAGVGSRRDMEQLIVDGHITVNGQPAHIGQRISFGDRIAVKGKPIRFRIAPPTPRVLAYHKPAGEVVSHDDPQQRPTVFRRLPRLQQGKWQSVGRLDINTEGLLLFTNSGELANQLMHPRFGVEREYAVRSLGVLAEDAKARLLEGVEIDGQKASFKSIEDGGGEGANHWYRVVITEGRNREVRKLFEVVGHAVSRLIRIRYGSVVLPRGLKRGAWIDLEDGDVRALRQRASTEPAEPAVDGPEAAPAASRRGARRGERNDRGPRPEVAERPPRADAAERGPRPERGNRAERGPRPDRGDRGDRPQRPERGNRAPRVEADGYEPGEGGPIPNPLQQTYDKRAIQSARALRPDIGEDGPIPNPLQQTYDKRALMLDRQSQRPDIGEDGPIPNPLQQTYDKRFAQSPRPAARGRNGPGNGPGKGAGNGAGMGKRSDRGGKKSGTGFGSGGGGGAPRQPDPMQTSVGYIGADTFMRKSNAKGRRKPGPGGTGGPSSAAGRPTGGGGGNRGGNGGGGGRGGNRGGGGGNSGGGGGNSGGPAGGRR